MNDMVNRVKLYVKDISKAHMVEEIVTKELLENDFIIDNNDYNIAISIGGDGTFIKMLHTNNFNSNIYYIGINAGSLGFLSSIENVDIKRFINNLKNKIFNIRELDILKTRVFSNNEIEIISINELTIRKQDFSSLRSEVYINNDLLEKYVGDGLVVSTSIGSTGYNLALSGPIVDPNIKAYTLTAIAPINNKVYNSLSNSMVISSDKKISVIPQENNNLCIVSDGKLLKIDNIKKIECSINSNIIKCIVPKDYNYVNNVRRKVVNTKEDV